MKTSGIIVEYNPFHQGHKYHINKTREITNSDYVVAIMSGHFTQRGTPAICDKWLRTKMALKGGADLIVELPLIYSIRSAEYFAQASVRLLDSLNIIDSIVFGSEYDNIDVLNDIAKILLSNDQYYEKRLKNYLQEGSPFPNARKNALIDLIKLKKENKYLANHNIFDILNGSNNILGIEYLKAKHKHDINIEMKTIKRIGQNYYSEQKDKDYISATAVRNSIYNNNLAEIKDKLISITGRDWVIDEIDLIKQYLTDETPEPAAPKATENVIVVKPASTEEISRIMEEAQKKKIPVIPRGAGTGLCGAAIPTEPSIILSLERLNQILEMDEDNLMVTCQSGLTLEGLFEAVNNTEDLFFPPHPGDEGAQVGGLVVENAGGARAVKYGVMRNYVKGMKVVLADGRVVNMGGKILKNNTGYDLMHLIIGSEGTLGIITEVTLRLYPRAKETATLLVPFENRHQAMDTVPEILKKGHIPLALEYVEDKLIKESAKHLGKDWPAKEGNAFLILIVTGDTTDKIFEKCDVIAGICKENGASEPLFAQRRKEQENILDIRSNIYTALEDHTTDILDVTVPPASIGDLLDKLDVLAEEYDTEIPVYGHAADGNVHPHIMKTDGDTPDYFEDLKEDIYKSTLEMGGVITGEHGIGQTRIKNLPRALGEDSLELMRRIKKAFDPSGILNPGKAISDKS